MKNSIWKTICLALPLGLMAAEWSGDQTAWGQSPERNASVTTASAFAEEELFDTQLRSQAPACSLTSPRPACTDATMGTIPQSLASPETVFAPSPSLGSLSAGQGALTAQNSVAAALMPGGYLDSAAPATMFRLRYDTAINNQFPDRGEYFYAKCGCFRAAGLDPNAAGPTGNTRSVNYQEIRPYFEYAFNQRLSVFTELPVRFVNLIAGPPIPAFGPDLGRESGFADMNLGVKYALIAEEDRYLTLQTRTYLPTGDAGKGLGTAHVSLEQSLLYYRRLSDNWLLQGQFTTFNPINGSDFASNVLQYGGGVGYVAHQGETFSIIPTVEVVGWTFLNGKKFNPIDGVSSARGDTIVNVKPGVRIGLGEGSGPAMMQRQSIYAGFGIPITGDQFYSDLFRVEYRMVF